MSLVFRETTVEDLPAVMKIINDAKALLAAAGSP